MAVIREVETPQWFAEKQAAARILAEGDERTGFNFDPTATPAEVRALMLAQGIRPEDNIFSRDIIRARYENEV
jgi:hypothetical protein